MTLSTSERFTNRVENYVNFRPGYPKEIVAHLEENAGLKKESVIADIGSGTGISARMFLENGNIVYAVEPNTAMRAAAENFLRDFPNFRSIEGSAEETNLPDESVDIISAGQAFHWFDRAKAPREFRRILRNDGFVLLFWNERRLTGSEFLEAYEKFLKHFGNDYEKVRHDQVTKEILDGIFDSNLIFASFRNHQSLNFEELKGRMLSASYMPDENSPRFSEMISELKLLFAKHQENGRIRILYDTNVYYGKP